MKAFLLALVLAAGLVCPAAVTASWGYPGADMYAQAPKGRPGFDRPDRRESRPNREERRERLSNDRRERQSNDRRERLSDDDRRALHRDLDKANRELYQRRHP